MLLRALRRRGHDLIGGLDIRLRLRHVGADAGENLEHFRLLGGGQLDEFAAVLRPACASLAFQLVQFRDDPVATLAAVRSTICCKSTGSDSYHFRLTSTTRKIAAWLVIVMYFAVSWKCRPAKASTPPVAPSMAPYWIAGKTSASDIATGVAPSRLKIVD